MKHCPNEDCSYRRKFGAVSEFVDTIEDCADCGTRLAPGAAPDIAGPAFRDLTTVYRTSDRAAAQIVRAALEANGLFAHVSGDSLQGAMGELPPTMLSLRVQVAAEHSEWAREIVGREAIDGDPEEDPAAV